jgi:hypothetical protein
MIYIPIIIIIIIIIIDLYYTKSTRFNGITFNNISESFSGDIIEFDEPDPWTKIHSNSKITKYYVIINNINKYIDKFIIWKELPFIRNDLIDIDVDNNYLIIKTSSEEESLVVCNLIISHINNDISIEEIISKNLMNNSINKAKKFKLVCIKLKELIKEGLFKLNMEDDNILETIDTSHIQDIPKIIQPIANKVEEIALQEDVPLDRYMHSKISPYEGSEYATINF